LHYVIPLGGQFESTSIALDGSRNGPADAGTFGADLRDCRFVRSSKLARSTICRVEGPHANGLDVVGPRGAAQLLQAAQKYLDRSEECGDISQMSTPCAKNPPPSADQRYCSLTRHALGDCVDMLEPEVARFGPATHRCALGR
jgi:hypothetical protein